jgi:hypothetical protein
VQVRKLNTRPLAQSAERLHGKYPVRIAVLTCVNASRSRPVYTELDALNIRPKLLAKVMQVTQSALGHYGGSHSGSPRNGTRPAGTGDRAGTSAVSYGKLLGDLPDVAALGWLIVFQLPPCAHVLNPIELVGPNLREPRPTRPNATSAQLTALVKTQLRRLQYPAWSSSKGSSPAPAWTARPLL